MKQAAGLLIYRRQNGKIEVLMAHPGGPFWAKKDDWSIPKGEVEEGENLQEAAQREFIEEIGIDPPMNELIDLGDAKASGKVNHIWAAEADLDLKMFHCISMATMQWPPRSGKEVTFPENDRAEWQELSVAHAKIFKSQMIFIERLAEHLGASLQPAETPTNSTLF